MDGLNNMTMGKVSFDVELPDFIKIERGQSVSFFVGTTQDIVTLDYNGNVTVRGNGGGAASFTINILDLLKHVENSPVRINNE